MVPHRTPAAIIAVALFALAMVLAACGGASPAASTGGDGGTQQSAAADDKGDSSSVAAAPSSDTGDDKGSTGSTDLESLADDLTPPNSTESARTTTADGISVVWESTDSVESLQSFYEQAIPAAGLEIFSTAGVQGSVSFLFSIPDNASGSGGLNITPPVSGGGGTLVSLIVGN